MKGSIRYYNKSLDVFSVLSQAEEADLIEKAQNGNRAAREKLVTANLRFVMKMAMEIKSKFLSKEDLIGYGNIGLLEAVDKFNAKKNVRFLTFARFWIYKEIQNAVKNLDRSVRLPQNVIAQLSELNGILETLPDCLTEGEKIVLAGRKLGMTERQVSKILGAARSVTSLDEDLEGEDGTYSRYDLVEDSLNCSPEEVLLGKDLKEKEEIFLSKLSERDRIIVEARSGFGYEHPLSLAETGNLVGLSKQGVRDAELRIAKAASQEENRKLFDGYIAA